MNIAQWIYSHAQHTPEKVAIHFEGEDISYSELAERVGQSARLISENWRLDEGDRIALLAQNNPETIVFLFACAQLGVLLVPLNWRLAEPELQHIIGNCQPRALIHDKHYSDAAKRLAASDSQISHVVGLDECALSRLPLKTLGLPRPNQFSENELLIVYTSGTTGSPKGAVLSQAAIRHNAQMSQHAYDMTATDVILNFLPLFHVGGLNIQLTPALALGAKVVLQSKFDPSIALQAVETQRVSLTNSVPTVLQALIEHPLWTTVDRKSLRIVSIGSTDVPTALIEAVHLSDVPVIQIYGATETAPIALYQRAELAAETVGSIGFAGLGCKVRLVDEFGCDVKDGEHGEIWISGGNVFQRYWNNPEATDLALVDGWFRTGDVARRDERGLHWFSDRIKHVVISGGENIYPAELERVLREQPGVVEVAVVGCPDEQWGEVPVAVVVRDDPNLEQDTLLACFSGKLARFKHPKRVVFCPELPRNAMAKVILAEVRELAVQT